MCEEYGFRGRDGENAFGGEGDTGGGWLVDGVNDGGCVIDGEEGRGCASLGGGGEKKLGLERSGLALGGIKGGKEVEDCCD